MNKTQKILVSVLVLAMIAFASAAIPINALVTANQLNLAGSSTVYPIATLAAQTFPGYWNGLVSANPSWGAQDINQINIQGLGSGTAFGAILPTTGTATADIGEQSRPPTAGEWGQSNAATVQDWAVGVDSVAIIYSTDMSWAPTQLTINQVAKLFMSTDAAGSSPYYTTWGQFLTAYYGSTSNMTSAQIAHMNDPINRIVRDPTSGTYDCWNNYFGKSITNTEVTNAQGAVTGSQYMAPYTKAIANGDVVTDITGATDAISFISMGYLTENKAVMTPISIYNPSPPAGNSAGFYAPTQANVISGVYTPWRWLWEVTPTQISSTGPNLAVGVWIAYMKLQANTVNGNPDFVAANDYMDMPRADMAGGQVLNSALAPYTPLAGQTQVYPDLKVDSNDFFYFMDAYITYYSNHIYNPYADIDANGVINGADFLGFMGSYVAYYTTYNPTH